MNLKYIYKKLFSQIRILYIEVRRIIYLFIENRAFAAGIVSRCGDCTGINQPGIYTNVVRHLKWINHHIQRDNC